MITRNQASVIENVAQGNAKKVLCVCSAGCIRSPTAAVVLSQEPFNFNTRSCGIIESFAIVPITELLISWTEEIVCMESEQTEYITTLIDGYNRSNHYILNPTIKTLGIADIYNYRDPDLMTLIKDRYMNCNEPV